MYLLRVDDPVSIANAFAAYTHGRTSDTQEEGIRRDASHNKTEQSALCSVLYRDV